MKIFFFTKKTIVFLRGVWVFVPFPQTEKKKNTKITEECSVINPLTNSDSASAKSKGALLVSAIEPIKKTKNKGNKGNTKLTTLCDSTISIKFKLPVNNTTNNITELNINS